MSKLKSAVPVLPVRIIANACRFYSEKLAFEIGHEASDYAVLIRDQIEIHLWAATDTSWKERDNSNPMITGAETFLAGTASCRVFVDDIKAIFEACRAAGIVHPNGGLSDKPYGFREFAVLDLDGNLITFFQRID